MLVPSLPNDWITSDFLRLLVQNLVVEERDDIRNATLDIWTTILAIVQPIQGWIENLIPPQLILDWYALAMTPLGVPIDPASLYYPSMDMQNGTERHNVDKSMLAQDLSLISLEVILRARVAVAKAFAWLIAAWPPSGQDDVFRPMLEHYIKSPSMLQKFLSGIIVEEWALKFEEQPKFENDDDGPRSTKLVKESRLALDLSSEILCFLQSEPPTAYHEMALSLARIQAECNALLQSFLHDCKVNPKHVPQLGTAIDVNGTEEGAFTVDMAQKVVGPVFTELKESLGRTKKKELITLHDKRLRLEVSIQHYRDIKNQYDIRVSAAYASAFVALKVVPEKVSPIVKGIMNGVKVSSSLKPA